MRVLAIALLFASCSCDDAAFPAMMLTLVTPDGAAITDAQITCSLGDRTDPPSTMFSHPDGLYACGSDTPGNWNVSITWHGHEVEHGVVVVAPSGQQCHPGTTTHLRFTLVDPSAPTGDAGLVRD